jgi:hypothetical protein
MTCYVEIIAYPEPCRTLVVRGEFDETINAYKTTNVVVIQPGTYQDYIALVS